MRSLLLLFFSFLALQSYNFADSSLQDLPPYEEIFVDVPQAQIYCRLMGQGEPLVVIHGGPGLSQDYLLPHLAKLAERNLVIFYDQRACGRSTGAVSPEWINTETFVEDLEALRNHLGLEKISLLGHSWGGFLAIHYALAYPRALDKLILLNSMPVSSLEFFSLAKEWSRRTSPYETQIKEKESSEAFQAGDPEAIAEYYRLIFSAYCYDPQKAEQLNLSLSPQAAQNSLQVSKILLQNLFFSWFNLHKSLKNIQNPALIIYGDHDLLSPSTAEKLHKSLPQSQFILLENCGQFPFIEKPEQTFEAIDVFLTR